VRVDSHIHLWDMATYDSTDWLRSRPGLWRSFLPEELKAEMEPAEVDRAVVVAAGRTESHNRWCLATASAYAFLGAVVAGVDIEEERLGDRLDALAAAGPLVGVRGAPTGAHGWGGEGVATALRALAARDLSLDVNVDPVALPAVAAAAGRHPSLRVVVDHLGVQPLGQEEPELWETAVRALAERANVVVKLSSLSLVESRRSPERTRAMADRLLELFGVERLLWGSNWPPETMAGGYAESERLAREYTGSLATTEREALFGGTARRVYRLAQQARV
jgi:L-fuconolactonase